VRKKVVLFSMITLLMFNIAEGKPVRVAYLQSDVHQLPCWVALDKGFFEKEGVKVEVAGIFKAGPELMSAFAAGALDMGYVGIAPATTAVARSIPMGLPLWSKKMERFIPFRNW
jgi:NitT/TauT family transport system substrate-binding protein